MQKGAASNRLSAPDAVCNETALGQAVFRASIMRSMMGARIISMANPILPPGTTSELRRDMEDPSSMLNR